MPTKRSPYFNLPQHRRRLAKPTPPSPFRLHLVPDGGAARTNGDGWAHRHTMDVKNSAVTGWRTP